MGKIKVCIEKQSSSNYGSNSYSVDFRGCDKTLINFLEGINEYYTARDSSSICNGSTVQIYKSFDDFRKDWIHPQMSIDIPCNGFVDISQIPQEELGKNIEPIKVIGFWGADDWYAYFT